MDTKSQTFNTTNTAKTAGLVVLKVYVRGVCPPRQDLERVAITDGGQVGGQVGRGKRTYIFVNGQRKVPPPKKSTAHGGTRRELQRLKARLSFVTQESWGRLLTTKRRKRGLHWIGFHFEPR